MKDLSYPEEPTYLVQKRTCDYRDNHYATKNGPPTLRHLPICSEIIRQKSWTEDQARTATNLNTNMIPCGWVPFHLQQRASLDVSEGRSVNFGYRQFFLLRVGKSRRPSEALQCKELLRSCNDSSAKLFKSDSRGHIFVCLLLLVFSPPEEDQASLDSGCLYHEIILSLV